MKNVEKTKASVSVNLELELDLLMKLHEASGESEDINKVVEDACIFFVSEGLAEKKITEQISAQLEELQKDGYGDEGFKSFRYLKGLGYEVKPRKNFHNRIDRF